MCGRPGSPQRGPGLIHHRRELSGKRGESARPHPLQEERKERTPGLLLRPGTFLAQLPGRVGAHEAGSCRERGWGGELRGRGKRGPGPGSPASVSPSPPRAAAQTPAHCVPGPRAHRGLQRGDAGTCTDAAGGEAVAEVQTGFYAASGKRTRPGALALSREPASFLRLGAPFLRVGVRTPPRAGPGTILRPEPLRDPPCSLGSTRLTLWGRSRGQRPV